MSLLSFCSALEKNPSFLVSDSSSKPNKLSAKPTMCLHIRKHFLVLADTLNCWRPAKAVFIAQLALSQQI